MLSPVKRELEMLATKDSPKIRREALFALKLAEKCKYVPVENDEELTTDDAIVRIAKKLEFSCVHERYTIKEEAKRYKCASDLCETKITSRH